LNGLILLVILGLGVYLTGWGANTTAFVVMFLLALFFGIAMVMPSAARNMPVVISLLNSFTGLAVAADGFVINNLAMVVAGTLVGSSGTLLTLLMCKAMNRPVTNVLFGAFGSGSGGGKGGTGDAAGKTVKPIQADEAALLLGYAQQVVIVPDTAWPWRRHSTKCANFPMNSASAAWKSALPSIRGGPDAGHMNVLLAEANVPYDQLCENGSHQPHDGPRGRVPRNWPTTSSIRRARGQEQPDLRHAHH